MNIDGDAGTIKADGQEFAITKVDNDKSQVTISGDYGERTYNLNPTKDGRVDGPGSSYKSYLYKEGSEALKKH
ncbi:hypothetical protein [Streptococcus pyogenes]|uniref:hypothetical protein n=1 Tax=Streptococcus pyogenes TaxID=1314 RepID=UPI003204E276